MQGREGERCDTRKHWPGDLFNVRLDSAIKNCAVQLMDDLAHVEMEDRVTNCSACAHLSTSVRSCAAVAVKVNNTPLSNSAVGTT